MRVLITDHAALGTNRTGVGYYASELIRCLRGLLGSAGVETRPGSWVMAKQRWWERQSQRYEQVARQPGWLPWVEKKCRGKFLALVSKVMPPLTDLYEVPLAHGPCDLYHEPNFIALPCELPTVATVHDLSVLLHPEWHPPRRVRDFEGHFRLSLDRCRHLFAISESGKRDIARHLGWPEEKVSVTYMGVRPGLNRPPDTQIRATLRRLGLKEGYLLHVGTLEPRKNVLLLLRAYCSLPESLRQRCPLVLAGGRGWNSDEVHTYLQVEARHKNVRWLGYVNDGHFPSLYSAARALVFPTLYEGFGMPAIEMMACGGAVLASSADAVAETAGGQAHLIDPNDEHGWRDAMLRVMTEDDWLHQLRQGAETHAARFTWEHCAAVSLAAYGRILGHKLEAA